MERVGDVEWFAHGSSNIFLLIKFFFFSCLKGDLKERDKKKKSVTEEGYSSLTPKHCRSLGEYTFFKIYFIWFYYYYFTKIMK